MPKKTKAIAEQEVLEANNAEEVSEDTVFEETESESILPQLSNLNMVLLTGFGVALLAIMVMLFEVGGSSVEAARNEDASPPAVSIETIGDVIDADGIERKGEGRHFYTTIKIPPGAETLYLSGSGASQKADGTWGSMEEQTVDTFASFKEKLEAEGWSMADIVQVRAFGVADEYGLLDFDGFNRAYREFFGTDDNPMKPVRSFVQVADLVVPAWLVEIEIRAARMPES